MYCHYLLSSAGIHAYNGNNRYICSECGKTFKKRALLQRHPCYRCMICRKGFSSSQRKRIHYCNIMWKLKCQICKYKLRSKKQLSTHCCSQMLLKNRNFSFCTNSINIQKTDLCKLKTKKAICVKSEWGDVRLQVPQTRYNKSIHVKYFYPVDHGWQVSKCKRIGLVLSEDNEYIGLSAKPLPLGKPSRIKTIVGDGNCFFRALAYVLTGNENGHLHLRNEIVEHIRCHQELFKDQFEDTNETFLEHMEKMKRNNEWATETEIFAAAHLLETDIYVYSLVGSKYEWCLHSGKDVSKGVMVNERNIYIEHTGEFHFDVVISVRSEMPKAASTDTSASKQNHQLETARSEINALEHDLASMEIAESQSNILYKNLTVQNKEAKKTDWSQINSLEHDLTNQREEEREKASSQTSTLEQDLTNQSKEAKETTSREQNLTVQNKEGKERSQTDNVEQNLTVKSVEENDTVRAPINTTKCNAPASNKDVVLGNLTPCSKCNGSAEPHEHAICTTLDLFMPWPKEKKDSSQAAGKEAKQNGAPEQCSKEGFFRIICALLNSEKGGSLTIQNSNVKHKLNENPFLDTFHSKINTGLKEMIAGSGKSYDEIFRWNVESQNYIVSVKPVKMLCASDWMTKEHLPDKLVSPERKLLRALLKTPSPKGYEPKDLKPVEKKFFYGKDTDLAEHTDLQAKYFKECDDDNNHPEKYNIESLMTSIKKQGLRDYVSAFVKNHTGGRILIGVKEKTESKLEKKLVCQGQIFKSSQQQKTTEECVNDVKSFIENLITNCMLWINQDGCKLETSTIHKYFKVEFHPVYETNMEIIEARKIIEVFMVKFYGIAFSSADGPNIMSVSSSGHLCWMPRKEWYKRLLISDADADAAIMHDASVDELEYYLSKPFVETTQFKTAKQRLGDHKAILITGHPGEGKTIVSFKVLSSLPAFKKENFIMLHKPDDWYIVCSNLKTYRFILIDDIFGSFELQNKEGWVQCFESINKRVEVNGLQQTQTPTYVVMSCRYDIFLECQDAMRKYPLFKKEGFCIHLSSSQLSETEKMCILDTYLAMSNKIMSETEKKNCVSEFNCPIGFPLCCTMFATEKTYMDKKVEFLRQPYDFLINRLNELKNQKLYSLFFLFKKKGKLNLLDCENEMSQNNLDEEISKFQNTLPSKVDLSVGIIKDCLKKLHGYVIMSGKEFRFSHNLIYRSVGAIYADKNMTDTIRACNTDFLCQCLHIENGNFLVTVPDTYYEILTDRLVTEAELDLGNAEVIAHHPALKDETFANSFCNFVTRKGNGWHSLLRCGDYKTSDGDGFFLSLFDKLSSGMRIIVTKCLESLKCSVCSEANEANCFSKRSSPCFSCKQTSLAMQKVCYHGDEQLYNMLLNHHKHVSKPCLVQAIKSGNLDFFRIVLSAIAKGDENWPSNITSLESAEMFAFTYGSKDNGKCIREILHKHRLNKTPDIFTVAYSHFMEQFILEEILNDLTSDGILQSSRDISMSFVLSYARSDKAARTLMLSVVTLDTSILLQLVRVYAERQGRVPVEVLEAIILDLGDKFRSTDPNIQKTLGLLYKHGDNDARAILHENGVKMTSNGLKLVISDQHRIVCIENLICEPAIEKLLKSVRENDLQDKSDHHQHNVNAMDLTISFKRLSDFQKTEEVRNIFEDMKQNEWDPFDFITEIEGASISHTDIKKEKVSNVMWPLLVETSGTTVVPSISKKVQFLNPKLKQLIKSWTSQITSELDIEALLRKFDVPRISVLFLVHAEDNDVKPIRNQIQFLKKISCWMPDDGCLHAALESSYLLNKSLFRDELLDSGLEAKSCCLLLMSKHNNRNADLLQQICQRLTNMQLEQKVFIHESLHVAYLYGNRVLKETMTRVLNEIKTDFCCLISVACETSDKSVVETLIHDMELTGLWDPDSKQVHEAFHHSIEKSKSQIKKLLIDHGVKTDLCCLISAAGGTSNRSVVEALIQDLKKVGLWKAHSEDIHGLFHDKDVRLKTEILQLFLDNGVKTDVCCLSSVTRETSDRTVIEMLIQDLKSNKSWNPSSEIVHDLFHDCIYKSKDNIRLLFIDYGVLPKLCCRKLRKTFS